MTHSARVAVVSDTHLPRFGRQLPTALSDALRAADVQCIVHCGDWAEAFVLGLLSQIAPTDGVAGNNDDQELRARLGTRKTIEIAGARLGVTHGHLGHGRSTPQRASRAFADDPSIAAVLFGHSHVPLIQRFPDGRWLINPGSPTDKRRQPHRTWALVHITEGSVVSAEIQGLPSPLPRLPNDGGLALSAEERPEHPA